MGQLKVTSGEEAKMPDMNFKDIMAKQGADAAEKSKKDSEEKQKFEGMKTHFAAGAALLVQEQKAKDDLTKAPADQRDALKQNLKDLSDKAAAEFQAAQKSAPEKDPNQALIWGNLGQAYDLAGRNDEAAEAYKQAIAAKPDVPGYYNISATYWRVQGRSTKHALRTRRAPSWIRRKRLQRGVTSESACTTRIGEPMP